MNYQSLLKQYEALLTNRWITNLANTSAFLMMEFPRINWVGFYLYEGDKLCLGPFQGKPACTEIELGRGVCGQAAKENRVIVVDDVHEFADHIVCDPSSRSEIVVPLMLQNTLVGVLDVDSQETSRFDLESKEFFINVARILLEKSK